jgi:hypothetical protein
MDNLDISFDKIIQLIHSYGINHSLKINSHISSLNTKMNIELDYLYHLQY